MRYVLRSGIVLENVFGKYLLIADEEARKECAFRLELDPAAGAVIEGVLAGKSAEEMARELSGTYEEDSRAIKETIEDFLEQMHRKHFLVPAAENEQSKE